jgi:uncharacterized membrane protein
MTLGMSTPTFTLIHVIISISGIFTGLVVVYEMTHGRDKTGWTAIFLLSTVLTSITGFFFHSKQIGPPHILGVASLVVLAVVIPALYVYHLSGSWRWMYIVGSVLALYFNAFVAVVQAFQKLPFLSGLAPTQSEPPFLVVQFAVLIAFVITAIVSLRMFHPTRDAVR